LSRPIVSPPYPPGGLIYYFKHEDTDGSVHHFTVLFWRVREVDLNITGISYVPGESP